MLSVRRRAARSFTIALVSALWSCGHEAAHTGGVAFAHSESGAAPTPTARFVGRMRPLAPWVADLRRRIDSRADAWPSEIAAEAAEGALRPALEALFARCDASALLVLARGGAFEVAPLAPGARMTVAVSIESCPAAPLVVTVKTGDARELSYGNNEVRDVPCPG